jgi:hypothetical protein
MPRARRATIAGTAAARTGVTCIGTRRRHQAGRFTASAACLEMREMDAVESVPSATRVALATDISSLYSATSERQSEQAARCPFTSREASPIDSPNANAARCVLAREQVDMSLNTGGRRRSFIRAGQTQKHPPDEGTPALPVFETM